MAEREGQTGEQGHEGHSDGSGGTGGQGGTGGAGDPPGPGGPGGKGGSGAHGEFYQRMTSTRFTLLERAFLLIGAWSATILLVAYVIAYGHP